MKKRAYDFKQQALGALRGNWFIAIIEDLSLPFSAASPSVAAVAVAPPLRIVVLRAAAQDRAEI